MIKIVIDTNVVVSALMSADGASYKLLSLLNRGLFQICLSTPLVVEYESVAKRFLGSKIGLTSQDVDVVVDYLCSVASRHSIYFLWRLAVSDPNDAMILELAVSAGCAYIVTHNVADFRGVELFGVTAITPKDFLERLGA